MTEEETKREELTQTRIAQLKSKGIPANKLHVDYPIRGENHFARDEKVKPTRRAELTVTSAGVLIEQKGLRPILAMDRDCYWVEF